MAEAAGGPLTCDSILSAGVRAEFDGGDLFLTPPADFFAKIRGEIPAGYVSPWLFFEDNGGIVCTWHNGSEVIWAYGYMDLPADQFPAFRDAILNSGDPYLMEESDAVLFTAQMEGNPFSYVLDRERPDLPCDDACGCSTTCGRSSPSQAGVPCRRMPVLPPEPPLELRADREQHVLATWPPDRAARPSAGPASVQCTGSTIAGSPLTFAKLVHGVTCTCWAKFRSASSWSYQPIGRGVIASAGVSTASNDANWRMTLRS